MTVKKFSNSFYNTVEHEMFTNFAKSRDSRDFHAREYLLLVLSYQTVFEFLKSDYY